MKYLNGELILETPDEIKIAVNGVKCLNKTAAFALDNSQKTLTYAGSMPAAPSADELRKQATAFEEVRAGTENWLASCRQAKESKQP